jgi:hypothetical protein
MLHLSNPQSTLPHPKSTVDLGCEGLIKVENGLVQTSPPTCHRPKIRPENKGIKPITNRHKPKNFIISLCALWPSAMPVSFVTFCEKFRGISSILFKAIPAYCSLFQPFWPPPGGSFFWRLACRAKALRRRACRAEVSERRRMAVRKDCICFFAANMV